MNIEIEEIRENIFLLKFKNQYEITSTFMRLQEFYESPYKGIKGNYFSLEKYMDRYAKENGNFTYNQDWTGFNVSGNIVRKFFEKFKHDLLDKEKELYKKIKFLIQSVRKFYLIGIYSELDLEHEISHAYYYLDKKYRDEMNLITFKNSSFIKLFKKVLKQEGYCNKVLNDEVQAYLSTSGSYLFGLHVPQEINSKYKKVFKKKDGSYL